MNREQAKKNWPFIKAYGEGKELQYRKVGEKEWHDERKHLGFCFDTDDCEFRIKPEENYSIEQKKEKHYRPFEDAAELILEYQNRFHVNNYCIEEPLIWVKKKVCSGDERSLITAYDINCVFIQDVWFDLIELFEKYTFLDGSVFGVEE